MTEWEAAETPLVDLLERIPEDAVLRWSDKERMAECQAPVGQYCHEALRELTRLQEERDEARGLLRDLSAHSEQALHFAQPTEDMGEEPADQWTYDALPILTAVRTFLSRTGDGK